jgi:hypothetical protein
MLHTIFRFIWLRRLQCDQVNDYGRQTTDTKRWQKLTLPLVKARTTKINSNLYFILMIVVLKFESDQITRTKVCRAVSNIFTDGRRWQQSDTIIRLQNLCGRLKILVLSTRVQKILPFSLLSDSH